MTTEYNKTNINSILTVKSIVTVLRMNLTNHIVFGESHDFPEIFYMSEGTGKTTIDGKEIAINAGQIIIYAPFTFHGPKKPSTISNGIADIISFETENEFDSSIYNKPITLTGEQRLAFNKIINMALPLFSKRMGIKGMMLNENYDPYTLQVVKNMLELFLLDLIKPSKNYLDSEIARITDYMIKNIDKVLTLQKMSFDLGISTSTLTRVVHDAYHTAPIAYFSELKIQEAKRLIIHSSSNFTEIALMLGFSSVHHFSRKFKQKTGLTPTEYATASQH